jgi:hypothetical protein
MKESMLLVFANIQVRSIETPQVVGVADNFAAFAIGYQPNGAAFDILNSSIGFINSSNILEHPVNNGSPEEYDVALFAIFDFTGGIPPRNYNWFGVYTSAMEPDETAVEVAWWRGSLQVIQLRD